ncbi:hypothetical protein [Lysobacter gummosus]|uniref:Lipoprotein n=1 Tax=Lysobacter gummosus TaxID=262324 RepID=A0ABY3XAF4_9GAMM|nr:hypothetical protein [Lysobacter gummosus]ALN94186.1 hypothetical protein LG3211_5254 [Lysobacter gummosus]UNP29597.1 hypothetical protein MOV92_24615 [Lysobacter gummosus]
MNKFRHLVLIGLLSLFVAACSSGGRSTMTPDEYLLHNVSAWNGATEYINRWLGGEQGEAFTRSLQERKNMKQYAGPLGHARAELAQVLVQVQTFPPPEDAVALRDMTASYLKTADSIYERMQKIAALPDGFSDEQVAPLGAELERLGKDLETQMSDLNDAQGAYAKKHGIQLQQSGG